MVDMRVFKSPLAWMKILIMIVLLAVVLLAFLGNEGHRLTFGKQDFLGVGVTLGLAIVIPIILVAYVLGGSLFVMEAILSFVAGGLLICVGVFTLDSYDHPEFGSPAGQALAGLCLTAGALFFVNLILVACAIQERLL